MRLDKETYEKIIYSREFKNWFGDWEHPNSKTSKIVDENGKPLVVYHGSPYKFTEFKYNMNQTSTQVSAGGGFWFSNYKVADHFSNCYPKSYYDEINIIRKKYNDKSNQEKRKFIKNVSDDDFELLYDFLIQQDMERGVYNIQNQLKSEKYDDIAQSLLSMFSFIGRRNIPKKLDSFIIKLLDLDKKFDDELEKELKKVKDIEDDKKGYIYPCFIYATNIIVRKGEDVGFGYGRLELETDKDDCIIIRNADTGPYIADEYVVFNPRRIKIATGENKTYSRKSKNIYENKIMTNFKIFENVSYKKQIEIISKRIVSEINETEFDYGKCVEISIKIANTIKEMFKVDCDVIKINSAKIDDEHAFLLHAVCVEHKYNMVIDTQLWQEFNNNIPDDLNKRKIVFDWNEYNNIITIMDSSLWYTTKDKVEDDN